MNIFTVILTQPLANGLILFYRILGQNMGIAIIAFSLVLRLVLSPLTKPYIDSMKKIRDHQKDLDKLKRRHKGDRTTLAKAQADFYKEKGINPSAGCLPYLLQIVVLIFLFRLFSQVFAPDADVAVKFNEFLYTPLHFSQTEQVNTQFLYLDVTKPDRINDLLSLPESAPPLPGLFIIAAALLQLVSAKMSAPFVEEERKAAKKTKEMSDDMQVAMQSSMIYMFPLMTILIGLNFASGLALYWVSFSAFQTYQQYRASGWGGATPWVMRIQKLVNAR
jgi:YidC/Oxa1 family membrane protein insertase